MTNCLVPVLPMFCFICFITGRNPVASNLFPCWISCVIYGTFNFTRNGCFPCSICYEHPIIFMANRQACYDAFVPLIYFLLLVFSRAVTAILI